VAGGEQDPKVAWRVAASELLAMHDVMMRSESLEAQAFGVLVLAGLADLIAGKTAPYDFSEEELDAAVGRIGSTS
jgi:hypothetical protein